MDNGLFNLDVLLSYQNVLVVIAAWTLITISKKVVPEFFSSQAGGRILPVLPVLVCEALVFATMSLQPEMFMGERALLGVVLGTLTANVHTLAKRFGLHDLVPALRDPEEKVAPAEPSE